MAIFNSYVCLPEGMLILTHTHRYINNICVVCVYALIHQRFTFTCLHLLSLPWPSKASHGQPLIPRKSWFRRAFVTYVAGEPSSPFVQMATELIKSVAWMRWRWMGHVYDITHSHYVFYMICGSYVLYMIKSCILYELYSWFYHKLFVESDGPLIIFWSCWLNLTS